MKCFKSNKAIFIILCFTIFSGATKAFTQEEKEAISLFEKRVDLFESFFSSKPKLLEKQSYKESPTGYIFFYDRFDDYKISYDVRKTDSLVSPYMGYITLDYLESTSKKCGNFEGIESKYLKKDANRYFTTIEQVRQKRDDESCYKPSRIGEHDIRWSVKFIFAFQRKQWVYKDVLNTDDNKANVAFYNAFGSPIVNRIYVEDNEFWKKLIE
jgi:hypothetical protein